uniref:Uncharacterized protein AlNc14C15G1713 n=1 Tax=Albugo laibachii Nc14 TaxID=890382 RepID=F0W426_9STRA|nr:conserved hypothetical protein [Albugo laibachii Nc14]|eukprot:CCA15823.1 conserved hypothetical protein [Albugo laibachii Nc14]
MKHLSFTILAFIWTQIYHHFNAPVLEQIPSAPRESPHRSSNTSLFDIKKVYNSEADFDPSDADLSVQIPNVKLVEEGCDPTFKPFIMHTHRLIHVTKAMKEPMKPNRVFFMLNGRNKGFYVSYNNHYGCMHTSAKFAAIALGADTNLLENGIRLYSQNGYPIRDATEFNNSNRIVHILIDYQIWVWPGIRLGHKYFLENGVVMTTVGMSPKVFDVEHFITANESATLIELGLPSLNRSKVVGLKGESVVDQARTSHTSYLPDSNFTRKFQSRGAQVARLPSPSFIEGLQLVRYKAGEFYRRHLDTFSSSSFKPKTWNGYTYKDFLDWVTWSCATIRELGPRVPEQFRFGGRYYPNANDTMGFHIELLRLFVHRADLAHFFQARSDEEWKSWIETNIQRRATDILSVLMQQSSKPEFLPFIVKEWERAVGLPELHYTFSKKNVDGLAHYYNWIRWVKDRVYYYGDRLPVHVRPGGSLYPSYSVDYQSTLMEYIMEDYSLNFIIQITDEDWSKWIVTNKGRKRVLHEVLAAFPSFFELVIRSWESRAQISELRYVGPSHVQEFHPQRFVTLFLYLSDKIKSGGETVFPYSIHRSENENINRTGMPECSTGLALPPRYLHAALFYSQTPEGELDPMSYHGGCPPEDGIKWGSNLFMWDSNHVDSVSIWS